METNILKQMRQIERRITILKQRLRELQMSSEVSSPGTNEGGSSHSTSSPTERRAIAIVEQREAIEEELAKLEEAKADVQKYISGIDDILIRNIIQLRYIEGKTWREIAFRTHNTKDSARMALERYLKK